MTRCTGYWNTSKLEEEIECCPNCHCEVKDIFEHANMTKVQNPYIDYIIDNWNCQGSEEGDL